MVAGAILAMGVAAATAMALSMITQEEINARVAKALNLQEQAVTLWQMGMTPAQITNTLPTNSNIVSLTFTTGDTNISGIGTVEQASITAVIQTTPQVTWTAETWTAGGSSSGTTRTNSIFAIRRTTR